MSSTYSANSSKSDILSVLTEVGRRLTYLISGLGRAHTQQNERKDEQHVTQPPGKIQRLEGYSNTSVQIHSNSRAEVVGSGGGGGIGYGEGGGCKKEQSTGLLQFMMFPGVCLPNLACLSMIISSKETLPETCVPANLKKQLRGEYIRHILNYTSMFTCIVGRKRRLTVVPYTTRHTAYIRG